MSNTNQPQGTKSIMKMTFSDILAKFYASLTDAALADYREEAEARHEALLAVHLHELAKVAKLAADTNEANGFAVVEAARLRFAKLRAKDKRTGKVNPYMDNLIQSAGRGVNTDNSILGKAAFEAVCYLTTIKAGSNTVTVGNNTRTYTIGTGGSWGLHAKLTDKVSVNMSLSTLAKYLGVVNQLVFVTPAGRGSNVPPVVACLYAQHAEIEISGLISNPSNILPILVSKDGVSVLKKIWNAVGKNKEDTLAPVRAFLDANGYVPVPHAENHDKHGYITHKSLLEGTNNLFAVIENGVIKSAESASKLIARLSKQVKSAHSEIGLSIKTRLVVVSADETKISEATRNALVASFAIGCGGFNEEAYAKYGVVRVVGATVAGQKMVVGQLERVVAKLITDALEIFTLSGDVMVCGLSSIKSAQAKADLVWQDVVLANGDVINVAVVEDCDSFITESAAALAFENVAQEELGLPAFIRSCEIRVAGYQFSTVLAKAVNYMDTAGTNSLVEAIRMLSVFGTIKRKSYAAKLNMQMLAAMQTQHGTEQVRLFLEAAFKSAKGKKAKYEIRTMNDILNNNFDPKEVLELDLAYVIEAYRALLVEFGAQDREASAVMHGRIIVGLADLLSEDGCKWTRLSYNDKSIVIPSGMILARNISKTNKATMLQASGFLAELIDALDYPGKTDRAITAKVYEITASKIIDARDKNLGKSLAQVEVFGTAGLIVSDWALSYGEICSPVVTDEAEKALAAYQALNVGFVWYKSPTIMAASVSGVKLVHRLMTAEQALLQGTAIYANALFVLAKQDDGDGDKTSIAILPQAYLLPGKLGIVEGDMASTLDQPTGKSVNPAVSSLNSWMADELSGLWTTAIKPAIVKAISWADYTASVVDAAEARGNVGIFTSAQQTVQAKRAAAVEAVAKRLVANDVLTMSKRIELKIRSIRPIAKDVAENLAGLIVDATVLVQGHATQCDSMDRIKHATGQVYKMLAKVLSPTNTNILHPATTVAEAEVLAANIRFESKVEGLAGPKLLAKIKELQAAAFSDTTIEVAGFAPSYGIDVAQLEVGQAIAGAYGFTTDAQVNAMFLTTAVIATSAAGFAADTTVDLAEVMFGNDNKLSKVFTDGVNAENVKSVAKNLATYDNVQALMLNIATK